MPLLSIHLLGHAKMDKPRENEAKKREAEM
jgi:hypothetical protein